MTNREKFLAAFTPQGTDQTPAVASYEGIFIRDHWFSLTEVPWWQAHQGLLDQEIAWTRDFHDESGLEWRAVYECPSRAQRQRQRFERRPDGMWLIDPETGHETRLLKPTPSGANAACASSVHHDLDSLPTTTEEVDKLIPQTPLFDRESFLAEGRNDAVAAVRNNLDLTLYGHIPSPLWTLYGLLGYEGMMVFVAQDPDLAAHAGTRILDNIRQRIRMNAALGVDAVWIEECLTDQISPRSFAEINVPILRHCVKEIADCGLKSIYYYCGNPHDRLDAILEVGTDAVHFEESKKHFTINIEDIVKRVNGRCVVFGNLDAIGVLQNGSDEMLRAEISRQLAAGRNNGGRFIMSTGSPITPGTPIERVRRYTDLVRQLAQE